MRKMSTPTAQCVSPQAGLSADLRAAIRRGEWRKHTSGVEADYVQGNVAILPADVAADFHRFCLNNPKPCPLLAVSGIGDPHFPTLGRDIDIRTDVPRYRVFRHGEVVDEPYDIRNYWRDDLVAFVIGCSFSFEQALLENGISIRHIEQNCNVPMYRTNIETVPAGAFHGPMVVSMRPMKAADAIRAIQITSRFPSVHGAPVHLGNPELIGIRELSRPDYGDSVEVREGELPVFWACGVTPQSVIAHAKPSFCITHYPGHMLITDLRNNSFSIL
jgi:uncharacterized protein YcsI (UPF0317 family)